MRSGRTETETLGTDCLTVDQCYAAIKILNQNTLKVPTLAGNPLAMLAKIAQSWRDRGLERRPHCDTIKASRDFVFIDRQGAETIIYSRLDGTYRVGRPENAVDEWAPL